MKVTYPRIISIQLDGKKPVRFTDAVKAAEYWARAKEEEWIEKNKDNPKYKMPVAPYIVWSTSSRGRMIHPHQIYDDARIRYRRLKRRALRIFRDILSADK
jgi:hypothetical protein